MPLDPRSVAPDGTSYESQPAWRQHFPVDARRDVERTRREFLGGLTLASSTLACGQLALTASPSLSAKRRWQSAGKVVLERNLAEVAVGQAMLFHYPNERSPCLFMRLADDQFVAFAQKCTHLACPVIPRVESREFHCPCHHGVFDMETGAAIAGPPRSPLPRIQIEVGPDGTLTAIGIEVADH